jgi:hypothetical protein
LSNYTQIHDASPSDKVGLLAEFSATSAISAGFNSHYMASGIDEWLGVKDGTTFSGVFSQAVGGYLSGMGNNLIQNNWKSNNSVWYSAWLGALSSAAGQVAHNVLGNQKWLFPDGDQPNPLGGDGDPLYKFYSINDIFKNFSANIASGVVQQLVGNWGTQWGIKNGIKGLGAMPDWYSYLAGPWGWAGYVNGLNGFQSDMYYDAFPF